MKIIAVVLAVSKTHEIKPNVYQKLELKALLSYSRTNVWPKKVDYFPNNDPVKCTLKKKNLDTTHHKASK